MNRYKYQREYYKKNREKILEKRKESEYDKEYRYKNIDKYREYWKKQNQKRREIKERKKFLKYLEEQMNIFEVGESFDINMSKEDKMKSTLSILMEMEENNGIK